MHDGISVVAEVKGISLTDALDFLLKDAFNISDLNTGLINGKSVSGDYVLKSGDNLEFLKPAGEKG
jgi:hypothetical protein